jgi:PRTRC genetic system protein A
MFGEYLIARKGVSLPPIDPDNFYEYVLAGNGVFVRAAREEFRAMVLAAPCRASGLEHLEPCVALKGGRLPLSCTQAILEDFRNALPNERLAWVSLKDGNYQVYAPPQIALPSRVEPADPHDPAGVSAFMDVHSHAGYPAVFSCEDDADELRHRLRIFVVIGEIAHAPKALVRVVVNGHDGYFPAASVMTLPEGMEDCFHEIC